MARKYTNIGKSIAKAGGYKSKVRRKKAGKKKSGKRRAKRKVPRRRKKSAKRRTTRGTKTVRRARKKVSRKKRASRTTVKVSGTALRLKCPAGKAAVGSFAKASRGAKTYTAIRGRCVSI